MSPLFITFLALYGAVVTYAFAWVMVHQGRPANRAQLLFWRTYGVASMEAQRERSRAE